MKTMNIRVRAMILKEDKIVLMYRRKLINGILNEYYVLPGGGVEETDNGIEEALRRELKEELNIEVEILQPIIFETNKNDLTFIYLCKYLNGNLEIVGIEKERSDPNNYYEIKELLISDLNDSMDFNYIDLVKKYLNK